MGVMTVSRQQAYERVAEGTMRMISRRLGATVVNALLGIAAIFVVAVFFTVIATVDCHQKYGQEDIIDVSFTFNRGCMVNTKERGWVSGKTYNEQIKPKQTTKEK